jgi:hypothetical protein
MRHLLGALGVLAASVLLAVSAALNWSFGYSLGSTEFDGMILGAASVAADCFKALMPFFFFAAYRNRMWSQMAACAVLWVVVAGYSTTSAIGQVAKDRADSGQQRSAMADQYKDLRADLKRAQEQLSWVPQHRPLAAVQADIENTKNQRPWKWTEGCTDVNGKSERTYCEGYHGLTAELASAADAQKLETRMAEISAKLGGATGVAEADPQAAMFARLTGFEQEKIQVGLTLFVALLLEIGSSFGLYVAFSTWRLDDRDAPAAPSMDTVAITHTAAAAVAAPVLAPVPVQIAKPRSGANDNKSVAAPAVAEKSVSVQEKTIQQPQRLVAPETDVERYYKESVETHDGSSLTATALYEDYCAWCEEQNKEPLALPTFGREFGDLGVQKAKVAGRVRYIGISLRSGMGSEEDKKSTVPRADAA